MPYVKSCHNRPIRVGHLLWRPNGKSHFLKDHWLKKSTVRALLKKGWLKIESPIDQIKENRKKDLKHKIPKVPIEIIKPEKIKTIDEIIEEKNDIIKDSEESIPVEVIAEPDDATSLEDSEEIPDHQVQTITEEVKIYSKEELEEKDMKELRDIAKRYNVKGRSKTDIIERILEGQSG